MSEQITNKKSLVAKFIKPVKQTTPTYEPCSTCKSTMTYRRHNKKPLCIICSSKIVEGSP